MLATYVHDLNPVIVNFGRITPRWYGLAYLCGFLAAYFILIRLAKRGMLRVPSDKVPDLVLGACIFGVLLGGRLGYCLLYDPRLLGLARDAAGNLVFPYWGVLAVWNGGMAAHGGVIFTALFLIYFGWKHRYSIVNIGDAASMVVPIGLFFGRIANFINGELYGHASKVAWAVKFPTEIVNPSDNRFDLPIPVNQITPDLAQRLVDWTAFTTQDQTVATLNDVIARGKLHEAERAIQGADANQIVIWMQDHMPAANIKSVGDLVTQLQSGSAEVSEAIRGKFEAMASLPTRHPSQLYEALLEGALLFIIVWIIGNKWRKDGMAAGAFLTLYPVMRIIGEQFRVGDDPKTILGITLSLGVWYSLLMLIPGLIFWGYWIKRSRTAEWIPEKPPKAEPKTT